jgi:hypothetical protein
LEAEIRPLAVYRPKTLESNEGVLPVCITAFPACWRDDLPERRFIKAFNYVAIDYAIPTLIWHHLYLLTDCHVQITSMVVLSLFSVASVNAQCCAGSGSRAAPGNYASECTATAGGGAWEFTKCESGKSCLSYKCTTTLAGVTGTTYYQYCMTSDHLKFTMSLSQVSRSTCSTTSSASVLKAMSNPLALVLTMLITALASVLSNADHLDVKRRPT